MPSASPPSWRRCARRMHARDKPRGWHREKSHWGKDPPLLAARLGEAPLTAHALLASSASETSLLETGPASFQPKESVMHMQPPAVLPAPYDLPDAAGHFGPYGGVFV